MTFLAIAAALVFAAGPAILAYLLFGESRRAPVRLSPLLVLGSLQTLIGVWVLGVLAAAFALDPWIQEQPDPALARVSLDAARTAAVVALLWLPAAGAVAVLGIRALHRAEVDRLQLPLVAIVFYGGALVASALRLMAS